MFFSSSFFSFCMVWLVLLPFSQRISMFHLYKLSKEPLPGTFSLTSEKNLFCFASFCFSEQCGSLTKKNPFNCDKYFNPDWPERKTSEAFKQQKKLA
jgi:hypothetical protein